MIKVKFNMDDVKKKKDEYPCIKIDNVSGRIVLFTAPRKGYEIRCDTIKMIHWPGLELSDFMKFSEHWRESDYELYSGKIELSNE